MKTILNIVQLIVAIILIVIILIQNQGASLGGIFGGEGNVYRTKRGAEKIIFITTIVMATLFIGLAIFNIAFKF